MLQFALLQSALRVLYICLSSQPPSLTPKTVHTLQPEVIPRPPIHVLQSDDSVIPHGLDHSQALWLCAHRSETISKLLFLLFELFLISIPIFEGIPCILLIFLYYIRCRFSTYRSQFPLLNHINLCIWLTFPLIGFFYPTFHILNMLSFKIPAQRMCCEHKIPTLTRK